MNRSALTVGLRRLRGMVAGQSHGNESDEQLLHAFLTRHDDSSFAALVRRHGSMVLYVCRHVLGHQQDAEDAFQATFLVLARNAALRNKTALASFLHGTAYRIAMKAKQSAARRRKHEGQAPPRSPADPAGELLWREVRALLDEEIARLPDAYQNVFILCCMENVSQAEAGRRLGLKERTVSNRLAAARKQLQERLSRRGVELSALLAATTLTTETASALPAVLLAKTVGGEVSPTVAALADSVAAILNLSKIKLATVLVLAASVLTGAGLWAYRSQASPSVQLAEPPAAQARDKPKVVPPKPETVRTVEIHGRVLGVDGKPEAGAKLSLLNKEGEVKQLGVSAADGRFTVTVPKGLKIKDRLWPTLITESEGAGIDFLSLAGWDAAKPIELRLVKDHPIRGRVVNTEGKPIRGVRVGVFSIDVYPNNSLDSFLIAWKKRPFNQMGPPEGEKLVWFRAAPLLAATTNAEGRFAISGVGAERYALLHLSGAAIADSELWIVNRDGFDPKPYNQARLDNVPKGFEKMAPRMRLHGPDVSIVAEPEKVVRGAVKDADSGKELPNIVVRLAPSGDVAERMRSGEARTDARGRYEFHGIPRAKEYGLVTDGDPSRGYLACQVNVPNNTAGYSPLTADLRLKKGVIVTGKVIDRTTGKSVPGVAKVAVLFDNPFARNYQRFGFSDSAGKYWADTAADGVFRVVTIPGPVVLMGRSDESRVTGRFLDVLKYKLPVPDAKYPQYFYKSRDGVWTEYYRFGGVNPTIDGNFCKVLDIKQGTAFVRQDIVLERASVLEVKIQDAEGRPVAGVWAADFASTPFTQPLWVEDSCCSVYSLEVRKPRLLVFYEPKKKIVGACALTGEEKAPMVVQLGSSGAIKGRLVDAEGQPLAGVVVDVSYRHYAAQQIHQLVHKVKQVVTDAAGAFTLDELIPEVKFQLSVRRGRQRFERQTKPADATIQVKPGECRDLGAIKLKEVVEKTGE